MLNLFPRTTKPEKKQKKHTHIPIERCAHKVCFDKKVNVEMTLLFRGCNLNTRSKLQTEILKLYQKIHIKRKL